MDELEGLRRWAVPGVRAAGGGPARWDGAATRAGEGADHVAVSGREAGEAVTGEPWTGRRLLTWLQAHEAWLDRPVYALNLDEDRLEVTRVEEDRFEEGGPDVILLVAE